MRILIAGATGALGSRLVPLLVKAGHEVFGTSRNQAGLAGLSAQGATGVVMDGLDPDSVQAAVAEAEPGVIVHQLTALGAMTGNPKKFDRDFAVTNRLRTEGTDHLLAAARDAGVRRFVAQSFTTWPNERTGGWVKTEDDPLIEDPGKEARQSLRAIRYLERAVTTAPSIEGVVLRYGNFYGPGNAASRTGSMGEMIRRGRFPIVGGGTEQGPDLGETLLRSVVTIDRGRGPTQPVTKEAAMRLGLWLGLFVVGAAITATFVYLARSRARVMRYHGIETPRIHDTTHGGGGGV